MTSVLMTPDGKKTVRGGSGAPRHGDRAPYRRAPEGHRRTIDDYSIASTLLPGRVASAHPRQSSTTIAGRSAKLVRRDAGEGVCIDTVVIIRSHDQGLALPLGPDQPWLLDHGLPRTRSMRNLSKAMGGGVDRRLVTATPESGMAPGPSPVTGKRLLFFCGLLYSRRYQPIANLQSASSSCLCSFGWYFLILERCRSKTSLPAPPHSPNPCHHGNPSRGQTCAAMARRYQM